MSISNKSIFLSRPVTEEKKLKDPIELIFFYDISLIVFNEPIAVPANTIIHMSSQQSFSWNLAMESRKRQRSDYNEMLGASESTKRLRQNIEELQALTESDYMPYLNEELVARMRVIISWK